MKQEMREVLVNHLAEKKLKMTRQRQIILDVFMSLSSHATLDEIHKQVQKKDKGIGFATVYRTMKLFVASGLASEHRFADGLTRYEREYKIEHHDHIICTRCGRVVEFENSQIEEMQRRIAEEHGFDLVNHRMEIYGVCNQNAPGGGCASGTGEKNASSKK